MARASYVFAEHDGDDGLIPDLGEKTYSTDFGMVVPIVKLTCNSPNWLSDNETAAMLRGLGARVLKVDGRPALSNGNLVDAEDATTASFPPATYPGKRFKPRRLRFRFEDNTSLTIGVPQRKKIKGVIDHILDSTRNKAATLSIELLGEQFSDVMPVLYRFFNVTPPTRITAVTRWNSKQSDDLDSRNVYYSRAFT